MTRPSPFNRRLRTRVFYYGQVDGEGGPETDAAVRRFQIRNGLEVTGKLNQQTISALHPGNGAGADDSNTVEAVPPRDASPSAGDTEAQTPPPQVVEKDHDFLRRHAEATPSPPDTTEPPPGDEADPDREAPAPPPLQAPPEAYTGFFRRTPYETAPLVVQRSTVHRAQVKLAREGYSAEWPTASRAAISAARWPNTSANLALHRADGWIWRRSGRSICSPGEERFFAIHSRTNMTSRPGGASFAGSGCISWFAAKRAPAWVTAPCYKEAPSRAASALDPGCRPMRACARLQLFAGTGGCANSTQTLPTKICALMRSGMRS